MAIKKLLVPLFMFFVLFSLLLSIFGHSGMLVNMSLERRLEELERAEEEKRMEVEALEDRINELSTVQSLDDLALSLGYNRDGDVVYRFQEEDSLDEIVPSSASGDESEVFEGVDSWILALASLGCVAIILVPMSIISSRSTRRRSSPPAEPGREEYEW